MTAADARRLLLEDAVAQRERTIERDRLALRAATMVVAIARAGDAGDATTAAAKQRGGPLAERVRASGLLLERWYAAEHGLDPRTDPAEHLADFGLAHGLVPNPFVDPGWYATRYGLADAGAALAHYLDVGAAHALPPGPLFDPAAYIRDMPEAATAPDVLVHFLRHGIAAGRLPQPVGFSWR